MHIYNSSLILCHHGQGTKSGLWQQGFSTKSQPDYGSQYICGSAVTLVFGLLFLLVSALLAQLELSDTRQSMQELVHHHVANTYTSLTGRPYVASQWEAILPFAR
jgi:hypothetical protein